MGFRDNQPCRVPVLIMRPARDAARSARIVSEAGGYPLIAPLFEIVATGEPWPGGVFDALVVTSRNALAPLAQARNQTGGGETLINTPLFAVGSRTAATAQELGFNTIINAAGTREDLIACILARIPSGARLMVALGRHHKPDLVPRLREAGHEPVTWLAYEARAVAALPGIIHEQLGKTETTIILHYSRRGAETFMQLACAAGVQDAAIRQIHLVLSADIAAVLQNHGAADVVTSDRADEATMLSEISGICSRIMARTDDNLTADTSTRTMPAMADAPEKP